MVGFWSGMLKLDESDVVGAGPTLEKVPTSPDVMLLLRVAVADALLDDDDVGLMACGRAFAVARMAYSTLSRAIFIVVAFITVVKERRTDSLVWTSANGLSAR